MNETGATPGGGVSVEPSRAATTRRPARDGSRFRTLEARQWWQFAVITAAAVIIYATMRLLPTGTNLNHSDFRVQGGNSIEFCDPLNPQFVPVVAARSPVTLTVTTEAAAVAGRETSGVLSFTTFSGKGIGPEDLLVVHEQKVHLMIVDPSVTDYQHVHPRPAGRAGEWTFSFTPKFGGTYRLFADFTPVATGRSLYANTDLVVAGNPASRAGFSPRPSGEQGEARSTGFSPQEVDGYKFVLVASAWPIRVRQPVDFKLEVHGRPGEPVPLQPIMGAYSHLVAFDDQRSGFAHLHPAQADPRQAPDRLHPVLPFKLTIPNAGRYVIWAQVNLGGKEAFAPFWFDVVR